jgi:hypothetical protein
MEDDNESGPSSEEYARIREAWEKRLESGTPIQTFEFDVPMDVFVGKEGDITMDCPCLQAADFDRPGIVRVRLTPEAASSLRRALQELEKSQGKPSVEPPRRFSH